MGVVIYLIQYFILRGDSWYGMLFVKLPFLASSMRPYPFMMHFTRLGETGSRRPPRRGPPACRPRLPQETAGRASADGNRPRRAERIHPAAVRDASAGGKTAAFHATEAPPSREGRESRRREGRPRRPQADGASAAGLGRQDLLRSAGRQGILLRIAPFRSTRAQNSAQSGRTGSLKISWKISLRTGKQKELTRGKGQKD